MSTRRRRRDCFSIPEILLFNSSPFAAPNSRSPPNFDYSLTFTLLLKNTRATLPHGRPRPGSNPKPPSPSTRRATAPPLPATTRHPLPTLHSLFVSPLFSYSYELLFPQPLYFDNDPHCPPGVGVQASQSPSELCASAPLPAGVANPLLSGICRLFSALPPFVFNRLQPLFAKCRGWGIPNATTEHPRWG
jgi:hypothetical protein